MRITHTLAAAAIGAVAMLPMSGTILLARDATPETMASCEDAALGMAMGTPAAMAGMDDTAGMGMGTPMPGMDHAAMELDQAYIDMMIPHHASIIAMAQAALPRLEDERLREIAEAVIATQQPEVEELMGHREALYGDGDPMPMDGAMMGAMVELMPGMSSTMEEMGFQMDAAAQVAAICAAENTDLAFIDMTIAHHQTAIESSEPVVAGATTEEIRKFAQRVIEDQQREIDELEEIRADLTGEATPAGA